MTWPERGEETPLSHIFVTLLLAQKDKEDGRFCDTFRANEIDPGRQLHAHLTPRTLHLIATPWKPQATLSQVLSPEDDSFLMYKLRLKVNYNQVKNRCN